MKSKLIILTLISIVAFMLGEACWSTETRDNLNYQPIKNNGKKWRIAYYQGGSSDNYYPYLSATVKGFIDIGWIERIEFPEIKGRDPEIFWEWLVKNIKSPYIEFIPDAFYNANWDQNKRVSLKKAILDRANKRDIDLIIAMGTWAGIDLANNDHQTPVIVMSSTDPVASGIISSNSDSGYDHVFARVDPGRWERQIRVFHKTIGFKKLGVVYEDSPLGRSYAAIDMIESIAKEKRFEVVKCFTKDDIPDRRLAEESVIKCFQDLVTKADAIYVVQQLGVNPNSIPKLVSITNKYRIPTFSQLGFQEVKAGFLMSITRQGGFIPVGRFLAINIAKIFNGAKPRQLNQVFEEEPAIVLNLKTAELIGLYLTAEILAAADEIYLEIENVETSH
ncbi:MAG: ABC transporter substrate-binding protein [Gammaproteobacteria bacterium]|nr:ABC transporter substrate-binding protein [Gammaproteobacteria bacterium]